VQGPVPALRPEPILGQHLQEHVARNCCRLDPGAALATERVEARREQSLDRRWTAKSRSPSGRSIGRLPTGEARRRSASRACWTKSGFPSAVSTMWVRTRSSRAGASEFRFAITCSLCSAVRARAECERRSACPTQADLRSNTGSVLHRTGSRWAAPSSVSVSADEIQERVLPRPSGRSVETPR